jgi:predicted nucleic acid-binding protein
VSKRKVSLSLGADLVDELEQSTDEGLSGQINEAVRAEVERRRRNALSEPFSTHSMWRKAHSAPDDEAEIRRYERELRLLRTGHDVVVPTLVLAELYRGFGRSQLVDALLARHEEAIACRDTDRNLARFVGAVLHAAGVGSEYVVAHVVAIAAEAGGGVLLTSDDDDLRRLAAPYRSILVQPLV